MELKSSLSVAKEEPSSDEHCIVAQRALWKNDHLLIGNSPLLRVGEKLRAPEDRLETGENIEGSSRYLGPSGRGEFKKARMVYGGEEDGTMSDPNVPLNVHQDEGGSQTPPSVGSYDDSHSVSGGLREEHLASRSYRKEYLASRPTNYNRKNVQKNFYSRKQTVPNYQREMGLCNDKLKRLDLKMNTMLRYFEKHPHSQRRTFRVQRTENISSSYQASKDLDMIGNKEMGDVYEGCRRVYETRSEKDVHYSAARPHEGRWDYPAFSGDGTRRISLSQEWERWPRRDMLNNTPPIVHCLRMLSVLDVQLGTLGPKVVSLLSEALLLEKKSINESMKLLRDQKVYMFFETVKEKMRGLLLAGVLDGYLVKTCGSVITDIEEMLSKFPFHPASSSTSDSSLEADNWRLMVERVEGATGQSGRQQLTRAPSGQQSGRQQLTRAPSGQQRRALEVGHNTHPLEVSLTPSPSSTPRAIKKSTRKIKDKKFCDNEVSKMNNTKSTSRRRNKSEEGKRRPKSDGDGYYARSSRTYYNSNRDYRRGEERRRQEMAEEWSRLKPWSAQQMAASHSSYTPTSYLTTEYLNNDSFYPHDQLLHYYQNGHRHSSNSSYGDLFF